MFRIIKLPPVFLDAVLLPAGSILYAISVSLFAAPNHIAPGGLTGISTMFHSVFGTPIGSVAALMNVPILFIAIILIGYRIVGKTILAIGFTSFLIDLFGILLPPYLSNPLLASVFAGVCEGFGLSLIFLRGGTTGGTDLSARLLAKHFPNFSMGKLMFGIDFLVIASSSFVYRSLESGLYGLIVIFVSTKVIDTVLYGMNTGTGKLLFIISEKQETILKYLLKDLSRGVTVLESMGAFSGVKRPILLCAVRKYEVARIRQQIRKIDENAFLIIAEAGEISGEGFRKKEKQDKTLKELIMRQ